MKGGVRTASKSQRRKIRAAMAKKTRKVRPTVSVSYKRSVPATAEVAMNVEAPVSSRPTRKAAVKAIERIHQIVNTKAAKEVERAAREEVAAEEAARKARLAERRATEALKRAAKIEEAEFTKPVGRRGETMKNITEMLSMMTMPSKGSPNSDSPVPVYKTGRAKRLSPVYEN